MKKIAVVGVAALALGVAGTPAQAQAQAQAQDATPITSLTQDQKDHGVETFRLLASAMQSQNVPDDIKSVLMGCMYENSVGKISEALDKIIAANPGKIDRTKPDQMLGVIARICGYEPPANAPAAGGKAPAAPAATGKAPAAGKAPASKGR